MKRYNQKWVLEIEKDIEKLISRISYCKKNKIATSIAFLGNVISGLKFVSLK
jgi:hypothetical protein